MLLFLCDRTEYGVPIKEKVHVYECTFSTLILNPKTQKTYRGENRVLVVCDTIEDAIAVCRKQSPDEFVLHQVVKRNQRCDLIVSDSVFPEFDSSMEQIQYSHESLKPPMQGQI
jgi:hypothetical protein